MDPYDHRTFALIQKLLKERDHITDEVLTKSFSERHLTMIRDGDLNTYKKWVAEAVAWSEEPHTV
jgi:hypothetical protein